jgi:hypothetical protein
MVRSSAELELTSNDGAAENVAAHGILSIWFVAHSQLWHPAPVAAGGMS